MDRRKLTRPSGRPLEIRTGHNPLELALSWATALGVAPALLVPAVRSSAVSTVYQHPPLLLAWYGLLLAWCVIALLGITPRPVYVLDDRTYRVLRRRLNCERIGIFGMAGTYLSFGFAAIAAAGPHGVSSADWLVGLAVGLFWRGGQITHDLHKITAARQDAGRPGAVPVLRDPDDPDDPDEHAPGPGPGS